jgi:hypothetical protein
MCMNAASLRYGCQVIRDHNGAGYPRQMALGYLHCRVGFTLVAPRPLAGTDDVYIDIVGLGTFFHDRHACARSTTPSAAHVPNHSIASVAAAPRHPRALLILPPAAGTVMLPPVQLQPFERRGRVAAAHVAANICSAQVLV